MKYCDFKDLPTPAFKDDMEKAQFNELADAIQGAVCSLTDGGRKDICQGGKLAASFLKTLHFVVRGEMRTEQIKYEDKIDADIGTFFRGTTTMGFKVKKN